MKKYLILPFLFLASLLTGCVEDINQTLKEVKAEPSVVLFEQQGGEKTVTVTATGDWTITNIPEWLKVDKTSGNQGTTEVKLQVLSAYDNLSSELYIVSGGVSQTVLVKQAAGEIKPTKIIDFLENGTDGKTYMIQGVVKNIINTVYGNLYINDGSSDDKDAYIYGMLDANGSEKNFLSLGIETGDSIIVQGPRSTYKEDIEIVNATLIKIKAKALLGAKVNSYVVANEAANCSAAVTVKGDDLTYSSDVDWLKINGTKGSGQNIEVLYSVEENKDAAPRNAKITLVSTKGAGDKKTESQFIINVKQLPATTAKKIAEVNFGGKEYVTVEGVVNAVAKSGLVIKDETGLVFIETSESAKIGAKVTATGTSEQKYARNKIVADKVVASDVVEVVYPTATAITKDNAATVIAESPAKYGYYTVSGYVNSDKKILIDGVSQVVAAIDPEKDVDLSSFTGKYVTACGYYVDNNSGKGEIQLVLVSVEETKEGAPKIFDLPKTSGSIGWNETAVKFQILADKDSEWKASLAEGTEGVSLSAASGKGSKDITVKFAGLNRTYTAQEAVVTVTVGEESKTFKAIRKGLTLSLKLDGNTDDITLDGGDFKVALTADLYWKVSVACSNAKYTATLSKEEGKGTDGLVITLPKNDTGADLTYTITAVDDRTDWQEGFVAGKGAELKIVQPGTVKEEPAPADDIELTLDGTAIKAAHTEAWSYTSGEKVITSGEYTWTAFNTYANAGQVTIQLNKGKGAYVLTPKINGGKITKIAVVTNRKNDGTGELGDRPLDIMTVDGTVVLDDAAGQTLSDGMEISGDYNQLKIACDEAKGGATYITKITIWCTL